ncbi:MAG: prephenate dehydratase [Alphaproteobacteria bacterium]|nr:prephenate dehydratase [Alphaproteobacteria bacterium]
MTQRIAFQGAPGAYGDMSCRAAYPDMETLPSESFEAAFLAVSEGRAELAMIPVDNTLAGRVADVHHLLPDSGLYIIGEHFQPVHHALLGVPGATKDGLKHVYSHVHALPQCRRIIRELGLKPHVRADTAGAAAEVAEKRDPSIAAIASPLAAGIYGLDILENDVQDADHNTTRFLVLSREREVPVEQENVITTMFFRVRNIPAALYKALGGFATNGINLTKLESYVDENFQAAQFYCDLEGHPDSRALQLAIEELSFFAAEVKMLGTYPAHPFRRR